MKSNQDLANALTLATALDEAIKAAKDNRIRTDMLTDGDPQKAILEAANGQLMILNGVGDWERQIGGILTKSFYRLPSDFVRPAITPDDLPDDLRRRLEEGIQYVCSGCFDERLMKYFSWAGFGEWRHSSNMTWQVLRPGSPSIYGNFLRLYVTPTKEHIGEQVEVRE